jgi:hypothetical protein
VIADAQLAATRDAGAQVALMNPGGIRAALPMPADGQLRYEDLFSVQPFYNNLVTLTLTGAQLLQVLEQQWAGQPDGGRVLHVSRLQPTAGTPRPPGQRVVPGSVRLNGQPLDPAAPVRVTVNASWPAAATAFRAQGRQATPSPASWTWTRWSLPQGQPDAGARAAEPHHAAELTGSAAVRTHAGRRDHRHQA